MMKLVEIKDLSPGEINEQIKKSSIELVDLRMKFTSRQLEDISQLRKKRKEIARLLTIQTQKLKEGNEKEIKIKKPKHRIVKEKK